MPIAKRKENDQVEANAGYINVQFRAVGTMKSNLLELEKKMSQPRSAIARQALYFYLSEKHGMK